MATGAKRVNITSKRFMSEQSYADYFFDYLDALILNVTSKVWSSQRGVFGAASLVSGGNDLFSVTTLPIEFLDGNGNIVTLDSSEGTAVPFENESAIDYDVAIKHVEIPFGVFANSRTGNPFYDAFEDRVGDSADPGSVSEASGMLTINVNSVFESGVDHSGRKVTVWLKQPVSNVESVAIERDLVVSYSAPNNTVTTAALLGQTPGMASTTASDYTVAAQGPTVRRNTNLQTTAPYAFIGTVTGGGAGNPPSGFSTTGQIDVSDGINPDLQEAYENGRTIVPNGVSTAGEVNINTTDAGSDYRAALAIDRRGSDGNEDGSACAYFLQDPDSGVAIGVLTTLTDSTNLQTSEPADKSGTNNLDFTRGGVDLTTVVDPRHDLVLLTGYSSVNGLFLINQVVDANTLEVKQLGNGGDPASWPVESGNAQILRARMLGYSTSGFPDSSGNTAGQEGVEFHGGPTASEVAASFFSGGADSALVAYNNAGLKAMDVTGTGDTRLIQLTTTAIAATSGSGLDLSIINTNTNGDINIEASGSNGEINIIASGTMSTPKISILANGATQADIEIAAEQNVSISGGNDVSGIGNVTLGGRSIKATLNASQTENLIANLTVYGPSAGHAAQSAFGPAVALEDNRGFLVFIETVFPHDCTINSITFDVDNQESRNVTISIGRRVFGSSSQTMSTEAFTPLGAGATTLTINDSITNNTSMSRGTHTLYALFTIGASGAGGELTLFSGARVNVSYTKLFPYPAQT